MNDLLERIIDGNGWLSIEEAPKNGTRVMIGDGICHWHKIIHGTIEYGGQWVSEMEGYPYKPLQYDPTHFQPMNTTELLVSEILRLRERDTIMREALEKLARLGTGSSHSNMIAKQAIEWADELNGGE
jgi:hypothetical protein